MKTSHPVLVGLFLGASLAACVPGAQRYQPIGDGNAGGVGVGGSARPGSLSGGASGNGEAGDAREEGGVAGVASGGTSGRVEAAGDSGATGEAGTIVAPEGGIGGAAGVSGSVGTGGAGGAGSAGTGGGAGLCSPGINRCSGISAQTCAPDGQRWQDTPGAIYCPVCGSPTWSGAPPSCAGSGRGAGNSCGPNSDENCCASLLVPCGTYNRSNDATSVATISDFVLDKYEITVGRFRAFVMAGMGTQANPPSAGAGANAQVANSGWDSSWNANLVLAGGLQSALKCNVTQTWTDAASVNDNLPINCITWYEAFAFCIWDGGRLPTEAEWNYAAAGGSEQREYPWSSPPTSTAIDDADAVYCGGSCKPQKVGSRSPKGDGKWGHADLSGNVWEWNLDWFHTYATPCNDCAFLVPITGNGRIHRGGGFLDAEPDLVSTRRSLDNPGTRDGNFGVGARCARNP